MKLIFTINRIKNLKILNLGNLEGSLKGNKRLKSTIGLEL